MSSHSERQCRHRRILEQGPAGRFCAECGERLEVAAMGDGGPCLSCGGNDGYGPAPHHKPDCYFASTEDARHAA